MPGESYDIAKLGSMNKRTGTLPDARHLIEVKEIEGKGLGIIARDRIPRGTRIIAESPLLKARGTSETEVDVQTSFDDLPPSKQQAYLGLHGHASEALKMDNDWESLPELNRRVLSIYSANHWGTDVFWLGSRFNHSCIPNVHNARNSTIQMETFHSVRDIEPGEELTISYIAGIHVRNERRTALNKWGFRCNCPACEDTSTGNELESHFVQLTGIDQSLDAITPGTLPDQKTLRTYQNKAALMRSIGITGKLLGNCYLDATICSALLGNAQMTILWAEKDVEVERYCVGDDHLDHKKKISVLKQLRTAANSKRTFHFSQIKWVVD